MLVVHDPTTAVDAVTEARIAAGLREIRRGRTTILVTTSPALLAVADRVVLLDGGRVAADAAPTGDLVHGDAGLPDGGTGMPDDVTRDPTAAGAAARTATPRADPAPRVRRTGAPAPRAGRWAGSS